MANRIAGPSASKRSASKKKKGSNGRKTAGSSKRTTARAKVRGSGPRSRRGWSGPVPTKQARGSNTTAPAKKGSKTISEEKERKDQGSSRAQATEPRGPRKAPDRRARPKARTKEERDERVEETPEGPRTYEITMDESLHGPEKMEAFKSKADEMVVGERTVIHHAARYGIVRGMTWTVILSALLFWLPLVGPSVAGYVGGRKAGGPLRGIIAVIIPALVMFLLLAAVHESMDLVPTGMASGVSFDAGTIADMPAQTIPLVAGLEQSLDAFVSSPPDVMFVMVVFAIVGGALSSLRRREEETVIEKVGIPLGELKQRILKEQAEQDGTLHGDPPSRWHPHPAIAGPVAAHDAFNELVEEVAQKVYVYMASAGEAPPAEGTKGTRKRSKGRSRPTVSVGEGDPRYEDLLVAAQGRQAAAEASAPPKARGGRRARTSGAGANPAPTVAAEAIVGDAEDWEVVNTSKGRRPIRVVRSPGATAAEEVAAPEHDMWELESAAQPPVVYEEQDAPAGGADLPEPPMYVEERGRGILGRARHRVVYPTAHQAADPGAPFSPHGGVVAEGFEEVPAPSRGRNYERLPIVGSIYETMAREGTEAVGVTGSVRSVDEPTIEDTREASYIAGSAARELVEMARYEEGPDMEPGEGELSAEVSRRSPGGGETVVDEVGELAEAMEEVLPEEGSQEPEPPATKPKGTGTKRSRPRAKSTARKVKHPTGSLKSRGKRGHPEAVYEEEEALVGVVEWNAREDGEIEEEDLFNPRRLTDDGGEDADGAEDDGPSADGPQEGSDEWAEEERIAALVRERDEWDRL